MSAIYNIISDVRTGLLLWFISLFQSYVDRLKQLPLVFPFWQLILCANSKDFVFKSSQSAFFLFWMWPDSSLLVILQEQKGE